jgi:hypothetical protein
MFAWLGLCFAGLLFAFGAYCAVDGAIAICGGFSGSLSRSIATGTISVLVGFLAFGSALVTVVVVLT